MQYCALKKVFCIVCYGPHLSNDVNNRLPVQTHPKSNSREYFSCMQSASPKTLKSSHLTSISQFAQRTPFEHLGTNQQIQIIMC